MSSWATMIDKLTHKHDVLFVSAVGNITRLSIQASLRSGVGYPMYLENKLCRIANPSQSSFSISVGSIDHVRFEYIDWQALAEQNAVSGFSRIGPGMWGQVKPDLVEYGGGIVVSRDGSFRIATNDQTAIELVHSTLHGGNAIGKFEVGTSFSTPKVTHIAAVLKGIYPNEGVNLIRALLVQGARLPGNFFNKPTYLSLRHLGYGHPSLERVIKNSDYRVTFYNTDNIKAGQAHLYTMSIPSSLTDPGEEYDVLIEVTLAYTARVRRTRQKIKSYLATWLDWTSSKLNETFEEFSERALKPEDPDSVRRPSVDPGDTIQWKIRETSDRGDVKGMNRNQGSLQKDWVILKSHQLPEQLSFAVRGHKGWDQNFEEIPYAITVSIEILGSEIPIYEDIKIANQVEIGIENEIEV